MTTARFATRWAGPLAILTFPREIDVANARQADEALGAALARRPATLIIDMTGTTFCDSSGIATLLQARKRAATLNVTLRIAGTRESVTRVMRTVGADRLLSLYPTLTAALHDQPHPN